MGVHTDAPNRSWVSLDSLVRHAVNVRAADVRLSGSISMIRCILCSIVKIDDDVWLIGSHSDETKAANTSQ